MPDKAIKVIRNSADRIFENKIVEDKRLLEDKKRELASEEAKLFSIEEKWITNKITQDTYERWFSTINNSRISLRASIERLSGNQDKTYKILQKNLDKLSDLEFVFTNTNTLEKQELVKLGFEQNLYYHDGVYRTPTMIDLLAHNSHIMREKGLLIYEKKRENFSIPPLSGPDGTRTRDPMRDRHVF